MLTLNVSRPINSLQNNVAKFVIWDIKSNVRVQVTEVE